jgi:hypothetical protein
VQVHCTVAYILVGRTLQASLWLRWIVIKFVISVVNHKSWTCRKLTTSLLVSVELIDHISTMISNSWSNLPTFRGESRSNPETDGAPFWGTQINNFWRLQLGFVANYFCNKLTFLLLPHFQNFILRSKFCFIERLSSTLSYLHFPIRLNCECRENFLCLPQSKWFAPTVLTVLEQHFIWQLSLVSSRRLA